MLGVNGSVSLMKEYFVFLLIDVEIRVSVQRQWHFGIEGSSWWVLSLLTGKTRGVLAIEDRSSTTESSGAFMVPKLDTFEVSRK
jgi:hypothetical protein